jgi:hypothetical protein
MRFLENNLADKIFSLLKWQIISDFYLILHLEMRGGKKMLFSAQENYQTIKEKRKR